MKKILNNLKIRNPETGKFESVPGVVGEYPGIKYNEEEVLTGDTWIDGKPIYRKAIEYTGSGAGTPNIATINNLSKIIKIHGSVLWSGDNCYRSVPFASFANLNWSFSPVVTSNGIVQLFVGPLFTGSWTAEIICEYTKTTD